jgi:fatty acid kinase/fatty acid kinase fatty acid binding subunit
MRIRYVDGARLRLALMSACARAQAERAELNRINVFPVPDGDTGTNLALTLASIADRLGDMRDGSAGAVATAAAEAAVLGARGNCGMILSHYLLGFSEAVGARARLSVVELIAALRAGVAHVYHALERPVEGTILTVMREVGEEAASAADAERRDAGALMARLTVRAREALARTPDLLPPLRRAGVVDAGAKGFVALLEGAMTCASTGFDAGRAPGAVESETTAPAAAAVDPAGAGAAAPAGAAASAAASAADPGVPAAQAEAAEDEPFRFCTEALVRGARLPDSEAVRRVLRPLGGSLIVIRAGGMLKVHVHTDTPELVFDYLRGLGELTTHKAEDMKAQHAVVVRAAATHIRLARRPVTVLTDSACDLPRDVVLAHGLHVVPLLLVEETRVLRDGIDITAAEFAERLVAGAHPTTSQPAPAQFLEGYRRAAEDGEQVVAVLLGSQLSGTFAAAEAAARRFGAAPVRLVDSRAASLLEGLLALQAAELAEAGTPPETLPKALEQVRRQSGVLFTVDNFDRLLASGRIGRSRAALGEWLDIKPILELGVDGRVSTAARVRHRERTIPRVMELLRRRIPGRVQRLRFGVVHVAAPAVVAPVVSALRRVFGEVEILSGPATPVIATHIGAGAWAVAYLVE